ncbi:MAG TPA: radical SAM protein [Steroidobacteraceae bacterium]|jgi:anaerobic magnesium-protoporphyrin IX monomethyl ester cyclase|nr:radical SAM protein [Steroidobacteraceae bacterium]
MLSVLVSHSYFLRFDPKQFQRAKPYPPLATLQVAGMLRRHGHQVALFDAMLADGLEDYFRCLREHSPQLLIIYEDNFNFLSKMCLGAMRRAACDMIRAARERGARIIVAGSDASDAPDPYLGAGADAVLAGEGLEALRQLVQRLDADPTLDRERLVSGIPGIAGGGSIKAKAQPVARRMDSSQTERPAWDLIDIESYRRTWQAAHGYFSMNMASSRGCSFRCAWCAKPIWGNRYLQREPGAVAEELLHLKRHFAPDHIWFADDIFGFRADWVQAFARAARAGGGAVPFTIQTRADLITPAMAAALSEAGCQEAWLGAESGSQRVLDAMNKGVQVAEIHTARARLKAAGIRVGFFIQLGYLGEQLEDILATRELIDTACPDDIGISVSYPLPGTVFYEQVKAQLGAKTHWQDSNDLAMMFQGTYGSEFYRAVRDLLHEQVKLQSNLGVAEAEPARQQLRRSWQRLVAREGECRT